MPRRLIGFVLIAYVNCYSVLSFKEPEATMNPFLILCLAIASEVLGSTALKASQGFTRLGPLLLVGLGYGTAFYLLSLSLKEIPLSIAYAIWSGVGTVGTVLVGVLFFRETMDAGRLTGIVMIVAGVVVLNHYSKGHP